VQLVFQDPFASLNPAHTILHHVARPLLLHGRAATAEVRDKSLTLLEACGLRPADLYLDQHPHSLSGGQRQRVAVARALATEPDVLLADEPTSMLDVSIRTDVLRLLLKLRDERGLAQVLVTHDLAAARFVADRILVLYGGMLMELSSSAELLAAPLHPYAKLLIAAVPRSGGSLFAPLPATSGSADVLDPAPGCPFAPRCPEAHDRCRNETPAVHRVEGREVRCHLHDPG
jgi:peptide/nickel transport system ATP-binding protein